MSSLSSRRVPVLDTHKELAVREKNYIFSKWDILVRNTVIILILTKLTTIYVFYIFFVKKTVRIRSCVL